MRLIFCSDPLNIREPDSAYLAEVTAARDLGIDLDLIHFESLICEDYPMRSVQRVRPGAGTEWALYRGWMLRPEQYERLYHALLDRGIRLINDPAAYRHCHYLPETYPVIEPFTPRSVWLRADEGLSLDRIMHALRPFGSVPIIVKDFVKSQKHYWAEACFIPSASNRAAVECVVNRFLELQGEDLNEGLVFREYEQFEPLAAHPRSGMPLTREYRRFFLDGRPICTVEYWDEAEYAGTAPPVSLFDAAARQVRSRFFTTDIARRRDGAWRIVELGDGQVAGLPERADIDAFFRAIAQLGKE